MDLLVRRSFWRYRVRDVDFGDNSAIAPVFIVESKLLLLATSLLMTWLVLTFSSLASIARVLEKLRSLFLDRKT